MSAREEVLRRVRLALEGVAPGVPVPRDYRPVTGQRGDVDLLVDRLEDYRAVVVVTTPEGVADAVAGRLRARASTSLVVPEGVPADWTRLVPGSCEVLSDSPPLDDVTLDAASSVLTSCALAVAETGTIVLDHDAGQGRRVLTLLPDHHVVVVLASQVVDGVADAVATLRPQRPMTWVSGPSATSDIELDRVEGVHGPRLLDVVVVQD